MNTLTASHNTINRAFTKQSVHYDEQDRANPILSEWRGRVYRHVERFLKPNRALLELNAGTGIDAMHFVSRGHSVHATDLSDGMVEKIQQKIDHFHLQENLSCQQCSFDQLHRVTRHHFDYIFSNFGGLNCVKDLSTVTQHFPSLLKPGGYVTLVVMPPVCPWEWLWIFKGHGRQAFRRLKKNGTMARLEGEFFITWYHTAAHIRKALGSKFRWVAQESLGLISPPPSRSDFVKKFPKVHHLLGRFEKVISHRAPFCHWGDHLIITFLYLP